MERRPPPQGRPAFTLSRNADPVVTARTRNRSAVLRHALIGVHRIEAGRGGGAALTAGRRRSGTRAVGPARPLVHAQRSWRIALLAGVEHTIAAYRLLTGAVVGAGSPIS